MNHARNKAIIRARLADGKSMTGVALNTPREEKTEGLFDTMVKMVKAGELVKNGAMYSLPINESVRWDGRYPIPFQDIEIITRGRPNKVISIGYMGVKRCYLNIGIEDAIERYKASEGTDDIEDVSLEVISFHDSFSAYDISD